MSRSTSRTRAAFVLSLLTALPATGRIDAQEAAGSGTIVVVNKAAANASIIDVASGETLATLPTGPGPHELVISSDGRTAVASNYGGRGDGGNTLTVIDIPGLRVARTIDVGEYRRPHGMAFLPGDSLLAVTSEATGNVVIVHVGRGEVVRALATHGNGSHMLAVVGDGGRIYTGNIADGTVSEIDVASGKVVRQFDVPPQPEAITVTRDGAEVWAGSNAEGVVSVIDTRSGAVTQAIGGLEWPYRVLISPDRSLAIIPELRGNALHFLDTRTREELGTIALPDAGPQGVTFGPPGMLFISLSQQNRIAVIDLEQRKVRGYIAAGDGPDGLGWTSIAVRP